MKAFLFLNLLLGNLFLFSQNHDTENFIYQEAYPFEKGLAIVKMDDKYGMIDKTGKFIIPCTYDYINYPSGGLILVKKNERWGYINLANKEIIAPKYEVASPFIDGLAAIKQNNKWGYINTAGKEIVPPKYDEGYNFSEGMALVKLNNKFGYIDKTGKLIIPCIFEGATRFSEGLAGVSENGLAGYINKSGKLVIPYQYLFADHFKNGIARAQLKNGWGFINKADQAVIGFRFKNVENFSEGVALVSSGLGWGFIDLKDHEVYPRTADRVYELQEGLAAATNGSGKYGFINKNGDVVVNYKYDETGYFNEGMSRVGLIVNNRIHADKFGFIDKTGKEVIPLIYDKVGSFSEGFAKVLYNGKWGYINKKGQTEFPKKLYSTNVTTKPETKPVVAGKTNTTQKTKQTNYDKYTLPKFNGSAEDIRLQVNKMLHPYVLAINNAEGYPGYIIISVLIDEYGDARFFQAINTGPKGEDNSKGCQKCEELVKKAFEPSPYINEKKEKLVFEPATKNGKPFEYFEILPPIKLEFNGSTDTDFNNALYAAKKKLDADLLNGDVEVGNWPKIWDRLNIYVNQIMNKGK
jgi:hypothetical protein